MGCWSGDTKEEEELAGPIEDRECRDVLFLIMFIAFLGGTGFFTVRAFQSGNPYRLYYGTDSFGNTCNQKNDPIPNVTYSGQDTTGKTKVFFFDKRYFLDQLPNSPISLDGFNKEQTKIICVEKCPETEVDIVQFYKDENVNLCVYGTEPYVKELCPDKTVEAHKDILNRCIPSSIITQAETASQSVSSVGDSLPQKLISDLRSTWQEIAYLCLGSVGVSLLMVVVMRFLAGVFVWIVVLLIIAITCAVTGYCWYTYFQQKEKLDGMDVKLQTQNLKDDLLISLILAIVASVVTVILLLILLVMRKRIALVVALFSESGKAIGSMPMLLLQPLITLVFLVLTYVGYIVVNAFVETASTPKYDVKTKSVIYTFDALWSYASWYLLFALFWISSFILACQDVVVAGAIATWYFCRDKKTLGFPILKSIFRLIRYHLGSVAFGSFIIAVIMMVRVILAYVERRLRGRAGDTVNFIIKCLKCCMWVFEKCVRFLNRNAYIEIAIYGYSFCSAARKAFLLIVANALRVAAINSIGDFVLLLGKLITVGIIAVIGHQIMKNRDDVNYIWVPIAVASIFAYIVADSFLLIYEMTIDTIFLCFLEDIERNDGDQKPFYMSTNLMSYLDSSEKVGTSNEAKTKQAVI